MDISNLYKIFSRVLFFGALVILVVAFIEIAANAFGYTVLRGLYSAGRLVELAAGLLVFVITVLLRQIRDALSARGR